MRREERGRNVWEGRRCERSVASVRVAVRGRVSPSGARWRWVKMGFRFQGLYSPIGPSHPIIPFFVFR